MQPITINGQELSLEQIQKLAEIGYAYEQMIREDPAKAAQLKRVLDSPSGYAAPEAPAVDLDDLTDNEAALYQHIRALESRLQQTEGSALQQIKALESQLQNVNQVAERYIGSEKQRETLAEIQRLTGKEVTWDLVEKAKADTGVADPLAAVATALLKVPTFAEPPKSPPVNTAEVFYIKPDTDPYAILDAHTRGLTVIDAVGNPELLAELSAPAAAPAE